MKNTAKRSGVTMEEIESAIEQGEEVIDKYFDSTSTRVGRPHKNVERRKEVIKTNLDLTKELSTELDEVAQSLNISRQALIKVWVRQALDSHYLAGSHRKANHKRAARHD